MTIRPQFITDNNGKKNAVILSLKEYNQLMDELEELEDIKTYDLVKAKNEKSIPFEDYLKKRKSRK